MTSARVSMLGNLMRIKASFKLLKSSDPVRGVSYILKSRTAVSVVRDFL